eukprot:6302852-Pyramimonas_sp.AAC.1
MSVHGRVDAAMQSEVHSDKSALTCTKPRMVEGPDQLGLVGTSMPLDTVGRKFASTMPASLAPPFLRRRRRRALAKAVFGLVCNAGRPRRPRRD